METEKKINVDNKTDQFFVSTDKKTKMNIDVPDLMEIPVTALSFSSRVN